MRLIPFLKKRKQNAAAQSSDNGKTLRERATELAREQVAQVEAPKEERDSYFPDIRRTSSLPKLVVTARTRMRQNSRSFADLRSFTDEYIFRKRQLMSAGLTGAHPPYPSYPPCARSQGESSAGSSTLTPSLSAPAVASTSAVQLPAARPIMREDALRLMYVPLSGDPNLKRARAPFEQALTQDVSPSVSRAQTAVARERENSLARALLRYTLNYVRVLSSVGEENKSRGRKHAHAKAPGTGRSMSALTRYCYPSWFNFRQSGQTTSETIACTPVDEAEPKQLLCPVPPTYIRFPEIREAQLALQRGEVPERYMDFFPFPNSCVLEFPCPPGIQNRMRSERFKPGVRYATILMLVAGETISLLRLLDNMRFVRETFGLFYVLCACMAIFVAICCTIMLLLSYWTQLEWARGNRSSAIIFPRKSLMV